MQRFRLYSEEGTFRVNPHNNNCKRLVMFSFLCLALVLALNYVTRRTWPGMSYDEQVSEASGEESMSLHYGATGVEDLSSSPPLQAHWKKQSLVDYVANGQILAFGDSLTHGMFVTQTEWRNTHPYAIELTKLLKNNTEVIESGVSGQLTSEMVQRLPLELKKYPQARAVLILGGTNDLGHRMEAQEVLDNLIKLHTMAQNASISATKPVYTIAITVPQSRWPFKPATRYAINEGLRKFALVDCPGRTALLDMESSFNQSEAKNAVFWSDDFVHLSPLGYDAMGKMLYDVMVDFTVRERCLP